MNSVGGRVVSSETGRGVSGLLVEVFDSQPSDASPAGASELRLASALTTAGGDFKLSFGAREDPELRKVNLLLTVSGPEEDGRETKPLFVSPRIRESASADEQYVIRIPEEVLTAAGVSVNQPGPGATEAEPATTVVSRFKAYAKRDSELVDAERDALRSKVERTRELTDAFRSEFRPAIQRRLSKVSDAVAASETFVEAGGPVDGAVKTVVTNDLTNVINKTDGRAPIRVRFALTADQRNALAGLLDGAGEIDGAGLDGVLGSAGRNVEYVAERAGAAFDRELSDRERAAAMAIGAPVPAIPAAEPTIDVGGAGVETLDGVDISTFVARQLTTMTSPEEAILAGLEPRADHTSMVDSVQRWGFKPSPAEVCAFYDFSHLQVAFRHVWQEAIDEGVLTLAESAYEEIVKAGGSAKTTTHRDPIRALTMAGELVLRAGTRPGTIAKAVGEVSTPGTGRRKSWLPGMADGVFDAMNLRDELDSSDPDPLPDILGELGQRLREPYNFTTFAANNHERSINFGCLVTYRQEWCPKVYQAGRIVKTVTLAPKEVQKYTKTIRRRTKRAEKEVKNRLQIRKDETSQTTRLEQDIVSKAQMKTNFQMSSEETAPGGAGPSSKIAFEREANRTSEAVKKAFHEAVVKSAQESKDEYSLEISTEEADEFELVETGELQNSNEAVAVAFLFYELQRRYRVTERLHRLTPVVFVAQEMPAPHEINESWLISHDWILRRVLLDDSFVSALDYLCTRIVGDQVAIAEIRTNITQQRQLIGELKQQLTIVRQRVATYRSMLEKQLLYTADKKSKSSGGGGLGGLLGSIPGVGAAIELGEDAMHAVGDFLNPDTPEVGDSRLDALKETIQRTIEEERDALMRVEREVTALNALTETYARMLADNQNQRALVLRLRTHVKQNITYYMQAIWNHEPPDQRYLRLHETPIPTFVDDRRYRFASLDPLADAMTAIAHRPHAVADGTAIYEAEVLTSFTLGDRQPLAKVADLDNLLGYFGNYMMFGLKDSNPMTDFMMEPFVLRGFDELIDPDDVGNWTLDEFADYVCALKERLETAEFDRAKATLRTQYDRLIKTPLRNGDEIVVPTGSVFIEALPAGTSLDEGLRRLQREMDVKIAQETARAAALRNLRLADRLLHGERDDPDIDKKVVLTGVTLDPGLPVDDPL